MLDQDPDEIRMVDWVTGAFMLVRSEARRAVGDMDERFFLYLEDTEWCYRMWKFGWSVAYVPTAVFFHEHGRGSRGWSRGYAKMKWWHITSFIKYIGKVHGRSKTPMFDWIPNTAFDADRPTSSKTFDGV